MKKISVISLISYDAHMLPESIKSYYDYVDEIILGLDIDRISWSKNKFSFDEETLWKELRKIDKQNKIEIVEDNFHKSDIAIENDNYERNLLKSYCSNDWIFSFDADEVLINPSEFFINFLPLAEDYYKNYDLIFTWFHPYKKLDDKYLIIANDDGSFCNVDTQGFATYKDNTFTYCRWTENKKHIFTPLVIMHWSFCRKDEEINLKINNYGHSDRTPTDPFYKIREQVNLQNYSTLRNLKTSNLGHQWPRLVLVNEAQLMQKAKQDAVRIY